MPTGARYIRTVSPPLPRLEEPYTRAKLRLGVYENLIKLETTHHYKAFLGAGHAVVMVAIFSRFLLSAANDAGFRVEKSSKLGRVLYYPGALRSALHRVSGKVYDL